VDRQKFKMLEFLAEANGAWIEIKAGRLHQFTGDEQVHAMRLSWFGLAERGARRTGLFRITDQGVLFLQGKHSVPDTIWCRDGDVIARSFTMVNATQVRNVVLDRAYWDNYRP